MSTISKQICAKPNGGHSAAPTLSDFDPSDYGRHAYCRFCGCDVIVGQSDFGIGLTEYWGARGVHRDMRDVCCECGEEL